MMDVWLLFSLFKPFIDIILQTYIETLRVPPDEAKDSDMDCNGDISKTAWQNGFEYNRSNFYCKINNLSFRSIHEKIQQNSTSIYLEKIKKRNLRKVKLCHYFNRFIYPLFYILFTVLFWTVGLINHFK